MSYLYDGKTYDNYDPTFMAEQVCRDKVSEIKAQLPIGVNPPITE